MADEGVVRGGEEPVGRGGVVAPDFVGLGHLPFVDALDCRVDARTGRMTLPAHLRPAFADGTAYLRPMKSGTAWMWTPLDFVRYQKRIEARRPEGIVDPRSRQRVFMSVQQVTIDSQGRFVLTQKVRDHLEVTDGVVLAGAGDRLELWPPARWYEEEATQLDEWDLEAETFPGLDLETGM